MGLFLNQNDQRTQLQEKIAADLEGRLRATGQSDGEKPSERTPVMLENTKKSTGRTLFWTGVVVIVLAFSGLFFLLVSEGI